MRERTYCVDCDGREIFLGDEVEVTIAGCNPGINEAPLNGKCPAPFRAKTEGRRDAIGGFRVPFGQGFLSWDADRTPCYEVRKVA